MKNFLSVLVLSVGIVVTGCSSAHTASVVAPTAPSVPTTSASAGSISVSVAPGKETVCAGQGKCELLIPVMVTSQNGFSGIVGITTGPLPAGVTASTGVDPYGVDGFPAGTPVGYVGQAISYGLALDYMPVGNYPITFTATTQNGVSASATVNLNISAAGPQW